MPQHADRAGRRGVPRWVLVAVVLLLVGAGVAGYVAYRAVTGPADAARAWLGHLRAGDYDRAYDGLCDRLRMQTSPADFRSTFAHGERVRAYRVRGVADRARTRAEVDVTVTLDGGPGPMDGRIVLLREGGVWTVCDTAGFA
jgi:hypothetical protein